MATLLRPPISPAKRAAVERLLRETDLTYVAIEAETGVSQKTVCSWNLRCGWRRSTRAVARRLNPADWPAARLDAVTRLYDNPGIDPGDLAVALGATPLSAPGLFKACGLARSRKAPAKGDGPPLEGPALDARSLRLALRGHIGRQIARFDAALLGPGSAALDTARVLRDLGGLKRLLDEAEADARPDQAGGGDAADDADADLDLPALRAEIAGRYATFAGERPDAGLPGEPAGPAGPGPVA